METVATAAIGLIGVLLGLVIPEYFRRRNRIEFYSKEVFEKRLAIYEELYQKLREGYTVALEIIEKSEYSKEERHTIWSAIVMDIAYFFENNELYINEDISMHCMIMIIGVEEIYYVEDPNEREKQYKTFRDEYINAKRMIKKESGLESLDKLFGTISRAEHRSKYIRAYKEAKKLYDRGEDISTLLPKNDGQTSKINDR